MTVSMDEILSAKDYDSFRKKLMSSECSRCSLSSSRTYLVVDRGNPKARVLIIGEAPGESEDLEGKAFVGRSGKLLDRLMQEVGFDTNKQSLIVNIVKCRPPDNRRPSRDEAKACQPFLKKQIDLFKPSVILLLGATSLNHILNQWPRLPMSEQVGKFVYAAEYPGTPLFVTYHPAYILRNPRKRPEMLECLRTFVSALGTL